LDTKEGRWRDSSGGSDVDFDVDDMGDC